MQRLLVVILALALAGCAEEQKTEPTRSKSKAKPTVSEPSELELEKLKADMRNLVNACKLFRAQVGWYPKKIEDLWIEPPDTKRPWKGPYLSEPDPKDPWDTPYRYELRKDRPVFISCGPDEKPDGTGPGADLESTNLLD